jgi:predicted ATPase
MTSKTSSLKPPFLKKILLRDDKHIDWDIFPFSLPLFCDQAFEFQFEKSITIIAGANGSGKSTFLDAIASHCGFGTAGGNRNHVLFDQEQESLSNYLRFSWLPKMTKGFFFRAETFFKFIEGLDERRLNQSYAGVSLKTKSHGESFIEVFKNQFGYKGIYILDEPEAALSPRRQTDLLRLLQELEKREDCQVIIATHSPLLMAYPNADLRVIENGKFEKREFHEVEHFKLLRDFYMYPDGFISGLLQTEND